MAPPTRAQSSKNGEDNADRTSGRSNDQSHTEGASETGAQVRVLREYEPDLKDIFLLIMRKLGKSAKSSSDLKGCPQVNNIVGGAVLVRPILKPPMDQGMATRYSATVATAPKGQIFEQIYRPWNGSLGPRWVKLCNLQTSRVRHNFGSGHRRYHLFVRLTCSS